MTRNEIFDTYCEQVCKLCKEEHPNIKFCEGSFCSEAVESFITENEIETDD